MKFSLSRVSTLLFFSGACALVYQVAWFRELRLVFGASTSASAAVLAVFMGGLGVGGAKLGKRADAAENPLAYYAVLELLVAFTAGVTPLLVWLAERAYIGVGGTSTLGSVGATVVRLALSVVVLGPSTLLMGGTLPAAARAVERASDVGRQRIATLYGVNTLGAVTGAVAANFLLLEVLGTRLTLWCACLVNALVGMLARTLSRDPESERRDARAEVGASTPAAHADVAPAVRHEDRWFPPFAAAAAGLSFMLMELVWYRMLAPLLGGSSYTFGLILAVALVGIAIGGALYARTSAPSSLWLFAMTCTLEALAIGIPYALGDRLAMLALLLRPLATSGFGASVLAWTVIASIVVLPAAIVSGFQFPAIIGLYGRGQDNVGHDVGRAYLANTVGSIGGSIGGGFGLLPLLSAPRCWQLVVAMLAASAVVALVLDMRERGLRPSLAAGAASAAAAVTTLLADGPTAVWRHGGIGAGRADVAATSLDRAELEKFQVTAKRSIRWEQDGLESAVALGQANGYTFVVNGKSDGHATHDAPTQVLAGLIPALLHPEPKTALVVGLGTGSTAGWLGAVPTMSRVDVVELEPAIVRVARDCAPVNHDALDNPKVVLHMGDAREALLTSRQRYDLVFSEPSNPYRAGISSLYTEEFYRMVDKRLNPGGIFAQWIQAYEVDGWAVATAAVTIREVFPSVTLWSTTRGDLLLVAQREATPIDVDNLRERLKIEPYATATTAVWKTSSAEGVLSHFVASRGVIDDLAARGLGSVNHDDQNLLEFAFARGVGNRRLVDADFRKLSGRLKKSRPLTAGAYDPERVVEERWLTAFDEGDTIEDALAVTPRLKAYLTLLRKLQEPSPAEGLRAFRALRRDPLSPKEASLVAEAAARLGDPDAPREIAFVKRASDRELLQAIWLQRTRKRAEAVDALERAATLLRTDPWAQDALIGESLVLAQKLAARDATAARRLAAALEAPFAVELRRESRLEARAALARASGDPNLCVKALDAMGVPFPRTRGPLELRASCYEAAHEPRLQLAQAELLQVLSTELPFGAALIGESAPPGAPIPRSSPPRQTAIEADASVNDDEAVPDTTSDAAAPEGRAPNRDSAESGRPAASPSADGRLGPR